MSKYQSLTTAIQLVEAAVKIMGGGLIPEGKAGEIIQDLRDIARDARYGGKWEGDFETVATALSYCEQFTSNCSVCPYKKEVACKQALKRDAKNAIRTLMARLEKEQEPRVMTLDEFTEIYVEFKDNAFPLRLSNFDLQEIIIYAGDGECRLWTGKPTDEQRKAAKWDERK